MKLKNLALFYRKVKLKALSEVDRIINQRLNVIQLVEINLSSQRGDSGMSPDLEIRFPIINVPRAEEK